MKEFLFSEEELQHLKFLKNNKPKKIWFNVLEYVFDYENFYFNVEIQTSEKNSINTELHDSLMIAKINFIDSKFLSQEISGVLISEKSINEIYIVRSLFLVRTHTSFTDYKNQLLVKNSLQINPNLTTEKIKNNEKNFLIDVGIVLKIENTFLNCFIYENDYDFFYINHLHQKDNLIEEKKIIYDFIRFM